MYARDLQELQVGFLQDYLHDCMPPVGPHLSLGLDTGSTVAVHSPQHLKGARQHVQGPLLSQLLVLGGSLLLHLSTGDLPQQLQSSASMQHMSGRV